LGFQEDDQDNMENSIGLDHAGGNQMIQNVKHNLSVMASLLFMCCLFGCATTDLGRGNRFYSGRPLPISEIALVFAVNDCFIYDIRDETEKEEKVFGDKMVGWGPWDMLDLLPGRYFVGVLYSRSTAATYELGGRVQVELNVQPGNIYVIYPEIKKESELTKDTNDYARLIFTTIPASNFTKKDIGKWRPLFINMNDYTKEECQRKFGRGLDSCYEKGKFLELATKYQQSERRIMSFHPFKEPIMNMWTKRVQNGVWR
jgi:hypothetical protein